MTPEAQRIAIAEACGWNNIRDAGTANPNHVIGCYGFSRGFQSLPDFLNDLNAMHEACVSVGFIKCSGFCTALRRIVVRDSTEKLEDPDSGIVPDFWFYNATTTQRAEAFLKTIGKWTE